MQIQHSASLKPYHTFAIEQYCDYLLEVSSLDELIDVYSNPALAELPKLVLGKGSNMLFTQPFSFDPWLCRLCAYPEYWCLWCRAQRCLRLC